VLSVTVFYDKFLYNCDKYQTLVCQIQGDQKLLHGAMHIFIFATFILLVYKHLRVFLLGIFCKERWYFHRLIYFFNCKKSWFVSRAIELYFCYYSSK